MNAPAPLSNTCFWKGGHAVACSYPNAIKTLQMKAKKEKDKANVWKSICGRVTDRMGMRWREGTDSEYGAGCKLRAMKDAHWKIHRGRLTDTQRGLWVRRGQGKNKGCPELIVACITWSWCVPPTVLASQSMSLLLWCMWPEVYGCPVPQCLATIALKRLLLIIKDRCRTLSLCLPLPLLFYRRANLLMDAAILWFIVVKDTLQVKCTKWFKFAGKIYIWKPAHSGECLTSNMQSWLCGASI